MRGTLRTVIVCSCRMGIIPAHAGNTQPQCVVCVRPGDHPRTCGEHSMLVLRMSLVVGSSPHMRGTLAQAFGKLPAPGIIPAHAGNTFLHDLMAAGHGDHPRTCGEHAFWAITVSPTRGSSPHMRGTLFRPIIDVEVGGIIPAHAGNTPVLGYWSDSRRDHPRTCGEHASRVPCTSIWLRIIPAHAGNTAHRRKRRRRTRDHPRTCGEHFLGGFVVHYHFGSSPHMRGTPYEVGFFDVTPGIIPAHAGNTPSLP